MWPPCILFSTWMKTIGWLNPLGRQENNSLKRTIWYGKRNRKRGMPTHPRSRLLDLPVSHATPICARSERLGTRLFLPQKYKTFWKPNIKKTKINNTVYPIVASLKDLGKKWFAFSRMEIGAEALFKKIWVETPNTLKLSTPKPFASPIFVLKLSIKNENGKRWLPRQSNSID